MNACIQARLFGAEIPRVQPLIDRYRALVEALDGLAAARASRADQAVLEHLAGQVVDAGTGLSAAMRPVMAHLPAISAALRDAAYYRQLDAHECSSGRCRNDRAAQQAVADAYTAALAAVAP